MNSIDFQFVENGFSPKEKLTTEQLATMFWNTFRNARYDGQIIPENEMYTRGVYDALNTVGKLDILLREQTHEDKLIEKSNESDKNNKIVIIPMMDRSKRTPEQIGVSFWCSVHNNVSGNSTIEFNDGYSKGIYDALNSVNMLDILDSENVQIN